MSTPKHKIGIFDSGIGGFSILNELISTYPEGEYFYYSDDANAPYGPKSDEFITKRCFEMTDLLISIGAEMIVVACNTATASSIDALRANYPQMTFVGVEPYLNAIYKENGPEKTSMAVITTESTGRSERFKRLKERLDPAGVITQYGLKNLARLIEDLFYSRISRENFKEDLKAELSPLKGKGYSHVILGCTHYPLVRQEIENELEVKTLRPCPYVAGRVKDLLGVHAPAGKESEDFFHFYSSSNHQWVKKNRRDFLNPLKK